MSDTTYTVKFPLTFENPRPGYDGIGAGDIKELVIFNMTNVLLTIKGERTFDSSFGVGLHLFLFENLEDNSVIESLKAEIAAQLDEFVPYATVNQITITPNKDDMILHVAISFTIAQVNISDVLEITLDQTGNFTKFGHGLRTGIHSGQNTEFSEETRQGIDWARQKQDR